MSDDASKQSKKKRNVPTKLKRLAEKRARIAGQLLSAMESHNTIKEGLAALTAQLQEATRNFEFSVKFSDRLNAELKLCDEAIMALNPMIKPANIVPIRASKGRYEGFGSLRNAIVEILNDADPEFLSTRQIADLVISRFSLVFADKNNHKKWMENSKAASPGICCCRKCLPEGPCHWQ